MIILRSFIPLSAVSFSPGLFPLQKKDAAAIGAKNSGIISELITGIK
jgi:hypothetical protein